MLKTLALPVFAYLLGSAITWLVSRDPLIIMFPEIIMMKFLPVFILISLGWAYSAVRKNTFAVRAWLAIAFLLLIQSIIVTNVWTQPRIRIAIKKAQQRGDIIADALELYKDKENKYPEHLNLLIPDYLEALPKLPFKSSNYDIGIDWTTLHYRVDEESNDFTLSFSYPGPCRMQRHAQHLDETWQSAGCY